MFPALVFVLYLVREVLCYASVGLESIGVHRNAIPASTAVSTSPPAMVGSPAVLCSGRETPDHTGTVGSALSGHD